MNFSTALEAKKEAQTGRMSNFGNEEATMKNLLAAIVVLIAVFSPVLCQVSGETEIGAGKDDLFFSQYFFYDVPRANVLVRYFWVNKEINRGEFAIGPTFHFGPKNEPVTLKLQFGGTTDREIMIASLVTGKIGNRSILHIADAKLATRSDCPNVLYQKVFLALTAGGAIQARAEHLFVGTEHGFLRLGMEYQKNFGEDKQVFLAPFYDPVNDSAGAHVGFRFF